MVNERPTTNTHEQSRGRRILLGLCTVSAWAWLTAYILLFLAWLVGEVARDRWLLTSLLFFIPSGVVALVGIVSMVVSIAARRRYWAWGFFLLALAPSVVVVGWENRIWRMHWSSPPQSQSVNGLHAVHWNVWWGYEGWEDVCAHLRSLDADIYVLSECPRRICEDDFPGYSIKRVGTMGIVVRGRISRFRTLSQNKAYEAHLCQCFIGNERVMLMATDVASDIRIHRAPVLEDINGFIYESQPDICVGDFNSPRRCLALANPTVGYRHAFESAGAAWGYTWPMPFPIFAIDQCLIGDRVRPHLYRLSSHRTSDHMIQHLHFTVENSL